MTTAGCDYSFSHPDVQALQAAGITFVCRYLSTDQGKDLSAAERDELHTAGISIVLNWETTADAALRGYQGGLADAKLARALAGSLGAPSAIPIYYSVDFDSSTASGAVVIDYLHGAADAEGSKALVGVYGGLTTVEAAFIAGFPYLWQTYAWSGNPTQWFPQASIRQTHNNVTIGGAQVDLDEAMGAQFGQWTSGATPPPAGRPLLALGASGPWVGVLQRSLMLAGILPGPLDGRFGTRTLAAVQAFQGSRGLAADGVCGPITWAALEARTLAVQQALKAAGFSNGGLDSIAGPLTMSSVTGFQTVHHLKVDGIVGPLTSQALNIH